MCESRNVGEGLPYCPPVLTRGAFPGEPRARGGHLRLEAHNQAAALQERELIWEVFTRSTGVSQGVKACPYHSDG